MEEVNLERLLNEGLDDFTIISQADDKSIEDDEEQFDNLEASNSQKSQDLIKISSFVFNSDRMLIEK